MQKRQLFFNNEEDPLLHLAAHQRKVCHGSLRQLNMEARRKLNLEFEEITDNPPPGVSARLLDEDNVMVWRAIICGPEDTPFEGGMFEIELQFLDNYPAQPPQAIFISPMFHPNVYTTGHVCLDILQSKWKPTYGVKSALFSIEGMLGKPNPNSPANSEANQLFLYKPEEYKKRVEMIKQ